MRLTLCVASLPSSTHCGTSHVKVVSSEESVASDVWYDARGSASACAVSRHECSATKYASAPDEKTHEYPAYADASKPPVPTIIDATTASWSPPLDAPARGDTATSPTRERDDAAYGGEAG